MAVIAIIEVIIIVVIEMIVRLTVRDNHCIEVCNRPDALQPSEDFEGDA